MKIRIAKFQGPISPPRYQEPPQIVQDIPPTHIPGRYLDIHGNVRQRDKDGFASIVDPKADPAASEGVTP